MFMLFATLLVVDTLKPSKRSPRLTCHLRIAEYRLVLRACRRAVLGQDDRASAFSGPRKSMGDASSFAFTWYCCCVGLEVVTVLQDFRTGSEAIQSVLHFGVVFLLDRHGDTASHLEAFFCLHLVLTKAGGNSVIAEADGFSGR